MNGLNKILAIALAIAVGIGIPASFNLSKEASQPDTQYVTTYTAPYTSSYGEYEPDDIQCPIPMKDRVPNYTGIQCVYSSIEMLGRWAEEPKLMNPPITSRSDCKGYSSPSRAASVLRTLNVKFEQVYGNNNHQEAKALLRKAMREGRGALFGIPGHAMVCVHYDKANDVAKWVDNSDRSLKVQTTTIEKFDRRWDGWVLVIYADNDIIPYKAGRQGMAQRIPIHDHMQPGRQFPKDYIPMPR